MSFLRVREPITKQTKIILSVLSFVIPILIWCMVSYLPFLWHPLVYIEDPGNVDIAGTYDYLAAGQLVEKEVFVNRNLELKAAGADLARGFPQNPIYFPAPHEVVKAFYTSFKTAPKRKGEQWLHESLWHSCTIIFYGFIFSAFLGIPIGILCGAYTSFTALVEPFVDFIRYMPAPVFGALAVTILGLDDGPKITIIFIGTFFQMVLVISNTTSKLDQSIIEAAQTLGTKGTKMLLKVVIPGILPELYRDMRILLGWAWTYLVVAELIGAKSGISAFLYQAQRYKQFDNVYASIIMIGLIGLCTDQILGYVGRHIFPWKK